MRGRPNIQRSQRVFLYSYNQTNTSEATKYHYCYEGYSKINLRLVGKNKRVVIVSKRTLSSNKELLFLLYAYPHTFSPRSVGVNTDKTDLLLHYAAKMYEVTRKNRSSLLLLSVRFDTMTTRLFLPTNRKLILE